MIENSSQIKGLKIRQALLDGTGLKYKTNSNNAIIKAYITLDYNSFNITFNDWVEDPSCCDVYRLDEPGEGKIYFAVFMDRLKGTVLAQKALIETSQKNYATTNLYRVIYEIPSDVTVLDVHIYSQEEGKDDFYPEASNFVGKFRLFSPQSFTPKKEKIANYLLPRFDKYGAPFNPGTEYFIKMSIPNVYSFYSAWKVPELRTENALRDLIEIDPDLSESFPIVKKEDRVFSFIYFADKNSSSSVSLYEKDTRSALIYLPEGISSFKIKVYSDFISEETMYFQYYIDLNKI